MGSGAKRRKRRGHRPSSRIRKNKLHFLVDHHITTAIREAVSRIEGYTTVRVQDLGLQQSMDQYRIKDEAIKRNAIVLTSDSDFSSPIDFRICTHPGVLWIHMSSQHSSHIIPRLKRFLQSTNYAKCRHALVELRDFTAVVVSKNGQEQQINYYSTLAG